MDKIRNYEDVRNQLLDSIFYYECRIKMWESVKFPTKKDGTPFKVLSKNFDGAKIGTYYPVEDWATPYLSVSGSFEKPNGYNDFQQDHMEIYVSQYNKRLPEHNEEREIRTSDWGSNHEIMTLEEIKSEIQHRIEEFKRGKARAEKALEMSEEKFEKVREKVLEIKEIVYGEDIECSTLEYALQGYVEGFGRYIN